MFLTGEEVEQRDGRFLHLTRDVFNLGEDVVVEHLQNEGYDDAEDGGDEGHLHARGHDGGADVAGELYLVEGHHHADHRAQEAERGGHGDEKRDPRAAFLEIGGLHRAVAHHRTLDVFQTVGGAPGKLEPAVEITRQAIAEGVAPQMIINNYMIKAMGEVGQRFQDGKAFVPQLLMAGRAMKGALELLKPLLAGSASTTIGKIVIGTVKGDLHDIGKNLVASMLEGCGFEVINIGIDVTCDKFVEAVKENHADILCMSALLTTTMTYMKEVIQALEEAGIRNQVKVMIGGAPVSQGFADEIGADGYSDNANTAVAVAKELIGNKK